MKRITILVLLIAMLLGAAACNKDDGRKTVAVIPKGTTHEFWQSVKAGAVKAGKELDVEVIWNGPEKEDDRAQQIAIVENMILKGVEGIVLAPLDKNALRDAVLKAREKKIPTVVIDSGLAGEAGKDFLSFVATDNYKGGQLGGKRTVEILGGKGKVMMLRYQENSESTEQREKGWMDVIEAAEGITCVSQEQRSGVTKESAQKQSEDLLDRFTRDGALTVDAIFCPNESSAYGMLRALQSKGLAGKVKYVGFDASESLIRALYTGEMHGVVLQDPEKMGYLGVKTMVRHLNGEKVDTYVDTGVRLITKEDLDKPETKALVPQIDTWLKDLRNK